MMPEWDDTNRDREDRGGQSRLVTSPSQPAPQRSVEAIEAWNDFESVVLDKEHLDRHRIVSTAYPQPEFAPFDVLRTKLMKTLRDRGWNRVAITSPTKGCGKTFVSANLALRLSQRQGSRIVLMDLDLRQPTLADVLGIPQPGALREFLLGRCEAWDHLLKVGDNLVVGLNDRKELRAAELLDAKQTKNSLSVMTDELDPDIIIYDMPPALYHDDVLTFLPQVDGVLLVVGGGISTASEIREVERLLADQIPLLGVILNKDDGPVTNYYDY